MPQMLGLGATTPRPADFGDSQKFTNFRIAWNISFAASGSAEAVYGDLRNAKRREAQAARRTDFAAPDDARRGAEEGAQHATAAQD